MGKVKFTLTNLIFWVVIGVSAFFFANLPLYGEMGTNGGFSLTTFSLFTFIIIFLLAIYYFLEHKKNKLKLDFVLLPICIIFFIWSVITIWTNKSSYVFTNEEYHQVFEVVVTNEDKWIATIESGLGISLIYGLVFVFGRTRFRSKQSLALPLLTILVVLLFSVISFFKDFETYKCFFTGEMAKEGITSVFHNENSFATWYMYGILCCFIINHYRPRWWGYFLMFYFFVGMIFTTCLSTLIISSASILIFTFYEIIAGFRKKWKKSLVLLIVFVFVLGALTGIYFIGDHFDWKLIENAKLFCDKYLFDKDVSTISHRVELWETAFDLAKMDTCRLIFGYGNQIDVRLFIAYLSSIIGYASPLKSAHSGFVSIMLRYGIAGLACYIGAIGYCLYSLIHDIVRKKVRFALLYGLCISCLLAHQLVESFDFFSCTAPGMLTLGIFFMQPIWANRHGKYEKKHRDILSNEATPIEFTPTLLTKTMNVAFLSLVFCSLLLLTVPQFSSGTFSVITFILISVLVISFVFYPYLITIFYQNSKTHRFVWRTFLNVLWALAIPSGLFVALWIFTDIHLTIVAVLSILSFALTLMIQAVIYTFARNGSFKTWGHTILDGLKLIVSKPILLSIMISGIIFALLSKYIPFDSLNMTLVVVITLIAYFFVYCVSSRKSQDNIIKDIDRFVLGDYKRILEKERD